ncbi:TonB-dependent siderophore receptor [Xenophilus arseniciresistens]|uniref:TonB-dependent siderophore receptor n=1 Tax=Xenophilus arseniciresistens TaxID=1283306 RepID=A0AAE3N6E8_9BURK|nr:TonB-dependent siderophore receptor [Xenophilus arseniciresistens]MDA7415211.1 TonB-dependent siderophore receptor [Xenophilus arseniciresistens]
MTSPSPARRARLHARPRLRPTATLLATLTLCGTLHAQGTAAADGQTLSTITVEANSVAGAPPVYPGGQVARGARLGVLGNVDLMDAPFSVNAYTAKTIEDQQARSIADVLVADPAVRQASPSAYGLEFYQLRGFLAYGDDITWSGMYGVTPYGRIPVELADRVEVLRGPSALLYGQSPNGSVGGSINIVPKRAEDDPITRITASYASDRQLGGAVDLGRRFGDRKQWGVRINAASMSGQTATDSMSNRRRVAGVGLDWRGDRTRFSLDLYDQRYRTNDGIGVFAQFSSTTVPKAPRAETNFFPGTYMDASDTGAMFRGEVDVLDNLTAYLGYGQRHHYYTGYLSTAARNVDAFGNFCGNVRGCNNATTLPPGTGYNDTRATEAGLRGNFRTGAVKHQWSLGGQQMSIDAGSSTTRLTPGFSSNIYNPSRIPLTTADYLPLPRSHTSLQSVALTDTLSMFDDRLKLTLGLREQRVSLEGYTPMSANLASPLSNLVRRSSSYRANKTTPAVGALFKITPQLSVYGNYIEGLTSGSQITDTAATNYGQTIPPLPTQQTELGLKWDLGTWTNTFAVYEIKKPSTINVYTTPTRYSVDAEGEQTNRGVEWNTFGQLTKSVRVLGGVAFTDAELTRTARGVNQGNTPPAAPKWKVNLGGEWDVPAVPGLTLSGTVIYNSAAWLNSANTQRNPAWTRLDLGARYTLQAAGYPLTIRATLQNATNRGYWDASWRDGLAILGAPRTFLLSATADF